MSRCGERGEFVGAQATPTNPFHLQNQPSDGPVVFLRDNGKDR